MGVGGLQNLGSELQIANRLSDRELKLMTVEDPDELTAALLPLIGHDEKVGVLREQHTAELHRPLEKGSIVQLGRSVFVARQNIHAAEAQALRHGQRYVVVHVKTKSQSSLLFIFSFARTSDWPADALAASTDFSWSSICASRSSLWSK